MNVNELGGKLAELQQMAADMQALDDDHARRLRRPIRLSGVRIPKVAAPGPVQVPIEEFVVETDADLGELLRVISGPRPEIKLVPPLAMQVFLLLVREIGYADDE